MKLRFPSPVLAFAALLAAFLAPAAPARAETLKIVALGDSLTAGYGLPAADGFTAQLGAALKVAGHDVEIVNAGVSGDTTSGGLERLDWSVPDDADGVILELGANDALRGLDPAKAKANLDAILTRLGERGVPVLLAGMRAPPNMGAGYRGEFDAIFPDLAARHGVALYPFFLDGVAGEASLNQGDGIHPTAQGVALMVRRMMPSLEEFIAVIRRSGS